MGDGVTAQTGIPATFMRGGTSKGLFFRAGDLPEDEAARDAFLLAAIGSPDPNGRQLDGMGGGVSSLSKAMIVGRSDQPGVDVDYLFAQIEIGQPAIDYGGNCGNLSSAVGVFAVEQGFVQLPDGPGVVRMYNLNTRKRIDCRLEVEGRHACVTGAARIAGVAGQGAPIRLDFLKPGGSRTGRFLPLGEALVRLDAEGGPIEATFIDAANPCVFVRAADLGLTATEMPAELRDPALLARLEAIRTAAARAFDDASPVAVFGGVQSVPKIAIVGPPAPSRTLAGEEIAAADCDLQVRMISMGQPHLAIPLTGAMCAAAGAHVRGSVLEQAAGRLDPEAPVRIATPSGVVPAWADVGDEDGWTIYSASVQRTARVLMTGTVWAPVEETS